jgi:hypothetical protein
MVQKFDFIPELDLLCMCCFSKDAAFQSPQFIIKSIKTNNVVYSRVMSQKSSPSSIKSFKLRDNEYLIYLGASDVTRKNTTSPKSGSVTIINLLVDKDDL